MNAGSMGEQKVRPWEQSGNKKRFQGRLQGFWGDQGLVNPEVSGCPNFDTARVAGS